MQEEFEKIIEKLRKERLCYFLTIANTGDEKLDCAYEHTGEALDKASEIVKQEAGKFGTDTHAGTTGCKNDVSVFRGRRGHFKVGNVDPVDNAFGSPCGHSGCAAVTALEESGGRAVFFIRK